MNLHKVSINIIDEQFNELSSYLYNLSVLIGTDRFFYLVCDEQRRVLVLRSYQISKSGFQDIQVILQGIFRQDSILSRPYKHVKVAIANTFATLVPDDLYQDTAKKTYLHHTMEYPTQHSILADSLLTIKAKNVYALNPDIVHTVNEFFAKTQFYHHSTPLLLGWRNHIEHQEGQQVFLHVLSRQLHIAVFNGQKLEFYNIFDYQSSKDFIYFVLLVFEQLQLKADKTPLTISGELLKDSEVYRLLYRYIRHVHFMDKPSYYRFNETFRDVVTHFFFDLYSLNICA